jgi:hypothetical protein
MLSLAIVLDVPRLGWVQTGQVARDGVRHLETVEGALPIRIAVGRYGS